MTDETGWRTLDDPDLAAELAARDVADHVIERLVAERDDPFAAHLLDRTLGD